MNSLIVGCNSPLAQVLINRLAKDDKQYLVGMYHKNIHNLLSEIEYVDYSQIDNIATKFDTVYFLASYIPYNNWNRIDHKLLEANLNSLHRVCLKFPDSKLIYSSSVSVYAPAMDITENSTIVPQNVYALTKYAGELMVSSLDRFANVRLSSLIGYKNQHPTFITRAIEQAVDIGEITLFGDGQRSQNYIDIEDAATLLIAAADNPDCGNYLGTNPENYTNLEIAEIVSSQLGNIPIVFKQLDQGQGCAYVNKLTRDQLNVVNFVDIADSIKNMINGR